MYEVEGAAHLETIERREEQRLRKRNAQLFKSLELPHGSLGGVHQHDGVPQANGNYDKLVMNWAESEYESSQRVRAERYTRLDDKVKSIVEKYCQMKPDNAGLTRNQIESQRFSYNQTAVKPQELSRYF
jgi:hypothetical protein